MKFKHFIGIDVGKHELFVGVLDTEQSSCRKAERYNYTIDGLASLLADLKGIGKCGEMLILMENTGKYCEKILAILYGAGHFIWLCSPTVLAQGTLGFNRLKDDPYDARQLALVARNHQGQACCWQPLSPDVRRLSKLWARRKQLVKDRTRAMNQRTSEKDGYIPDMLFVNQLNAQIKQATEFIDEIDAEIEKQLKASPKLNRQVSLLKSIPGVGPQIAIRVIAITGGFEKISNHKAFAAFISTAPFAKSSGTTGRKTRKVSKKGDRITKSIFYLGIMSAATRKNGFWKEEYLKLIERGHHHNSAINAIINKVIRLIFKLIDIDEGFNKKKYHENKRLSIAKKLQVS